MPKAQGATSAEAIEAAQRTEDGDSILMVRTRALEQTPGSAQNHGEPAGE